MSIPLVTLLRRPRSPLRESRSMIANIKPLGPPIPNLTTQSIWNILLCHARTKLKIGTSYSSNILQIGKWIQGKETFEKIKMGIDPKESFAQMNKNCYVQDRIRGQMMKLNPPKEKKTS